MVRGGFNGEYMSNVIGLNGPPVVDSRIPNEEEFQKHMKAMHEAQALNMYKREIIDLGARIFAEQGTDVDGSLTAAQNFYEKAYKFVENLKLPE